MTNMFRFFVLVSIIDTNSMFVPCFFPFVFGKHLGFMNLVPLGDG